MLERATKSVLEFFFQIVPLPNKIIKTIKNHKTLLICVVDKRRYVLANEKTHPSSMTLFVHLFIRIVIQKVTIVTSMTI